jgi:hypothetical protein
LIILLVLFFRQVIIFYNGALINLKPDDSNEKGKNNGQSAYSLLTLKDKNKGEGSYEPMRCPQVFACYPPVAP